MQQQISWWELWWRSLKSEVFSVSFTLSLLNFLLPHFNSIAGPLLALLVPSFLVIFEHLSTVFSKIKSQTKRSNTYFFSYKNYINFFWAPLFVNNHRFELQNILGRFSILWARNLYQSIFFGGNSLNPSFFAFHVADKWPCRSIFTIYFMQVTLSLFIRIPFFIWARGILWISGVVYKWVISLAVLEDNAKILPMLNSYCCSPRVTFIDLYMVLDLDFDVYPVFAWKVSYVQLREYLFWAL